MTPTIPDLAEALTGLALLAVIVALIIALRVVADRMVRAERRAAVAAELARIAETKRDVLAARLRAVGLSDVVVLDAGIRSYADARRKAGA